MGNWPPSRSRLASLLVVLMGGAAGAVRVVLVVLGVLVVLVALVVLLYLLFVCGAVEALFFVLFVVLVSVSVLLVAPLAAAVPLVVNSPMCGGKRSSAGRRISVIPDA